MYRGSFSEVKTCDKIGFSFHLTPWSQTGYVSCEEDFSKEVDFSASLMAVKAGQKGRFLVDCDDSTRKVFCQP